MAIEFRCTRCETLLRTGDETVGKQAKCPQCGTVMTIPSATIAPAIGVAAGSGNQSPGPPASLATSTQGGITPTALDLGDVFGRTWTIFKPNWGMCLVAVIIVLLIGLAANLVSALLPIVGGLIAWLFGVWLGIGLALFFLKTARGQDASLADIFSGTPFFLNVLLANILLGLAVFVIVLLCAIPPLLVGLAISQEAAVILAILGALVAIVIVVYVMLSFSQFYYLILDRQLGVIDSFTTSRQLMQGNKATLLVIGLLSALLTLVALIPCGLGLLIAWPYFTLMYPVVYLVLTGQPTADLLPARATTQQAPTAAANGSSF